MKHVLFLLAFLLVGQAQANSVMSLQTTNQVPQQAAPVEQMATSAEAAGTKRTFKERVTTAVAKKMIKKAAKRQPMLGIEDLLVLVGIIVIISGILSLFGSLLYGLLVIVVGVIIYLLGKNNGGSLGNIF
jgi:Flp pilus assembly protein TadB